MRCETMQSNHASGFLKLIGIPIWMGLFHWYFTWEGILNHSLFRKSLIKTIILSLQLLFWRGPFLSSRKTIAWYHQTFFVCNSSWMFIIDVISWNLPALTNPLDMLLLRILQFWTCCIRKYFLFRILFWIMLKLCDWEQIKRSLFRVLNLINMLCKIISSFLRV